MSGIVIIYGNLGFLLFSHALFSSGVKWLSNWMQRKREKKRKIKNTPTCEPPAGKWGNMFPQLNTLQITYASLARTLEKSLRFKVFAMMKKEDKKRCTFVQSWGSTTCAFENDNAVLFLNNWPICIYRLYIWPPIVGTIHD